MASLEDLRPRLSRMLRELDRRAALVERNRSYLDGSKECPIPTVVRTAQLTNAYRVLMPMAGAPWASLIVDSVQDRLEVGGIRTGDRAIDREIWSLGWQANQMDAGAKIGQSTALSDGRVFATSWPDEDEQPEIVLDGPDQMVIEYREGRYQSRHRVAALRRWVDEDGRQHITLYGRSEIYKFKESKDQTQTYGDLRLQAGGRWWEPREEMDSDGEPEPWPLKNPYNVVPVVEIATNRRLQPGVFPFARGEFDNCIGLLDRINLLTFLGLVVALWMGFPLRGVIGDRILRTDDGRLIPPFESRPDSVIQLENPDARVVQLEPADRKNLSIFAELSQLAYVTKTPAHYFPQDRGISNISADTIAALDGGLHAKVGGIHKPFLGEGWEELLRVVGLMLPSPLAIPPTAEVWWLDHESRSLAERADAAVKLGSLGLPTLFIAERYLNFTQEETVRLQAAMMSDAFARLVAGARAPPDPEPDDEVVDPELAVA